MNAADKDLQQREDPYNVTQASRIYFLPNLMTAGNLFCGFMAVVSCVHARLAETAATLEYLDGSPADHYRYAVWFILGAAAFDTLDGRLARMGGRESLFGAEFDSLADVVSFGFAPALLMFFFILSPTQGIPWFRNIGWFVGFVFLLCAAIRLARFNVITNPLLHRGSKELNKDFVGLPVPAAAATVASLVLFLLKLAESDKSLKSGALGLPFLMVLIAMLMVSTVRYPSGKKVDLQTTTRLRNFVYILAVIGLVVLFKEVAVLGVCLGYIFFGLVRHWRRPHVAHGHPSTTARSADSV
ncbi:CDP-diacylglycerol--serine O-phosphatidyltransferase [Opitutus terrae]|uniref:CDP-diacylglycerol--serine O-phosphatidyltransferase n=1 Tax=Opitutus terrae (strain DSM 11246 / JCM 15787 / PB90-1) TaxID=452637 RepID=B1ZXM0_OPITP|nr:CDP-diacylglycerol--serine O-phosphatidyltransferase [Opitutus terrae]ACB74242.1 CDP-diacylglycerol--serine O-phosphatidyltransferase [Opitutus terrae PB90-1]